MSAVHIPATMNTTPYYDDFDQSKKFLRFMFRGGYAVQARELTQLQTMIQNQLSQFGGHVFKDGSKVIGSDVSAQLLPYFRAALGYTGSTDIQDFVGQTFGLSGTTSATTQNIFEIVHIAAVGATYDSYNVVFYKPLNGLTVSVVNSIPGTVYKNNANGYLLSIGATSNSLSASGYGHVVSVDEGFRFVDGFFVYNEAQSIAPYAVTGNTRNFNDPTVRVGFDVSKSFVDHLDDSTLNDPAYGSYNYGAPGADRYKINLEIGFHSFVPSTVTASGNYAIEDFVEFCRIESGEVKNVEKYPEYSVIEETLARRTYDESGNYTVRPFNLRLSESASLSAHELRGTLDPGKAYIFGYEFETQAPNNIVIDRARPEVPGDSSDESVYNVETLDDIDTDIGNYVALSGLSSVNNFGSVETFNLEYQPEVWLSAGLTATPFDMIGVARVRDIRYASGASGFNVYLTEVSMSGSNVFGNTKRLFRPGITSATAALFEVSSGVTASLVNPSKDTLIFEIPKGDVVKEITEMIYGIRKAAPATFTSGVAVLNKSDFGSDVNHSKADFAGANGVLVSMPGENTIVFTQNGVIKAGVAGPTTSATQLRIELTDTTFSGSAYVIGSFDIQDAGSPLETYTVKGLSSRHLITITGALQTDPSGASYVYLNGLVDVASIITITANTGGSDLNLTNYFDLDTGQRDNLYDWSRIVLKSGYNNTSLGITGPFSVSLAYYTRESGRGPFIVNSYDGLTFSEIPTYTSTKTGQVFDLGNVLDFRPDRAASGVTGGSGKTGTNYTERYIPHPLKSCDINYDYYLPRTDKIVLTKNKTFEVIKGAYSDLASPPPDRDDAMTLYTVRVNPYTFDEKDVNIRYVENKRYTMRDIGKIEKRLDKVEYYTTLSLLEQETNNLEVLDSNGDSRFKNGILVDSFRGHAVGDVLNQWYSCSMNFERGELRPSFRMKGFDLTTSGALPGSLTQTNGRLVMLDYSTTPAISQPIASKSISINPFNVVSWMGQLNFNPSSDTWFDTTQRPAVLINSEGENDAWIGDGTTGASGAFGTQWNTWETNWNGQQITDPNTYARNRSRNQRGDANSRQNNTTNNQYTDSYVSRNTRAQRAGQVVNGTEEATIPDTIQRSLGNRIVNTGIIPFIRSQNVFITADSLKPNTRVYPYFDGTLVSSYVTPPGGVAGDPIYTDSYGRVTGLTFALPGGVFPTGERLFRLTDEANNTVANATTTAEQIFRAQGLLLTQEETIISTRVPTIRRETCNDERIVNDILSRSRDRGGIREGWVDPLAQSFLIDAGTNPRGIFVDSVDLFFAAKSDSLPVTVQIRPMVNGYPSSSRIIPFSEKTLIPTSVSTSEDASTPTNFKFDSPVYLAPGEYAIVAISNSNDYTLYVAEIGENRLGTSERITAQPYAGVLFKSQNASTWSAVQTEDLTFVLHKCVFEYDGSEANRTGLFTNVSTTEYDSIVSGNVPVHVISVNGETILPPDTDISTTLNVKTAAQLGSAFSSSNDFRILMGQTIELPTERAIDPNWSAPNNEGVRLSAIFGSDSPDVSPVIDLDRLSIVTVENVINNNTSMTGSSDNGELAANPGGVTASNRALARYITKQVTLEDEFESNDLRVYTTVAKPIGTSIKVFGKFNPPESSVVFDSRPYVELPLRSGDTDYVSKDTNDFVEQIYEVGGAGLTQSFKTFALKVVMFSDDAAQVPILRDIRAIALPTPI